jgi:hypothetical protein
VIPRFDGPKNPVTGVFPRQRLLRFVEITLQQSLILFPLEIVFHFPDHQYQFLNCHECPLPRGSFGHAAHKSKTTTTTTKATM